MGILNFKKKSAHKFIKKQLNKKLSPRKFGVEKISKVGVIAEIGLFQAYDFTKRLCSDLDIDTQDVQVYLFDPAGQSNSLDNYKICGEDSFGLYGKIKSSELSEFVNSGFDLLINYCDADIIYVQIIVIKSKAKMKAGFEHEGENFNDISIKVPGNKIDTFNTELVKYLQILKLIN